MREDRRINAATSIALFRALEKRYRHGTIHVVCDNVRYYRCAKVCNWLEGRRINLVFLPPYSPNLNLAERLWKLMRAEVIDAIYYENFAAFRDALLGFFRYLGDQTARLTTLMTPRFHIEEVRVAG